MRGSKRSQPLDALQNYIKHPPVGSALQRAIDFGIDPSLTFHNMYALSAEERLAKAGESIRAAVAISKMRRSKGA